MALQQEAIKWIAGTDFMVDGFKFQNPRCRHYFLTHFHSDHTIGLSRSFHSGTIFCSRITAALLTHCMGLRPECIQVLPLDQPLTLDGVEVTALDANHCPGSVMLLFKVPGQAGRPAQVILHTGDFRYHERMEEYPSLRNTLIDTIYLDTTYAYPRHTFPSQEDAIATIVRLCRKHLADEARPLFVFGAYQIGKERAVIGAAKALGLRVHIEPRKRRILALLDLQDMHLFTPNAADADIHLGFMSEVRPPAMLRRLKEGGGQWAQVVGFRPTGWSFRKDGVSTSQQGRATVYGVPYSEHSSFDDLRACIAALRPRKIIPTVNADTKLKAANLVARFADLMDRSANRYRIDAFFRPRPAKRLTPGVPTTDKQSPDGDLDAFPTDGLDGGCPVESAFPGEDETRLELSSGGVTDDSMIGEDGGPTRCPEERLSEGVTAASVMGEGGGGCGLEQDGGVGELEGAAGLDCEGPEEEAGFDECDEVSERGDGEGTQGLGDEHTDQDCEGCRDGKAEGASAAGGEECETAAAESTWRNEEAGGGPVEAASGPSESECGRVSWRQKQRNDERGSEDARSSAWSGENTTRRGGRTGLGEAELHARRQGVEVAEAEADPHSRVEGWQGRLEGLDSDRTGSDSLDTWHVCNQEGDGGQCWEEIPVDRLLPAAGVACEAELRTASKIAGELTEGSLGETWRDCTKRGVEPEGRESGAGTSLVYSGEGRPGSGAGELGGPREERGKGTGFGDGDPATHTGQRDDDEAHASGQPSAEGKMSSGPGEPPGTSHGTNDVSAECMIHSCEMSVDLTAIDSREQAYILWRIEQAKLKTGQEPRGKRKVTAAVAVGSRVANRKRSGMNGKRLKSNSPSVTASECAEKEKSEGHTQGQTLIRSFFRLQKTT